MYKLIKAVLIKYVSVFMTFILIHKMNNIIKLFNTETEK